VCGACYIEGNGGRWAGGGVADTRSCRFANLLAWRTRRRPWRRQTTRPGEATGKVKAAGDADGERRQRQRQDDSPGRGEARPGQARRGEARRGEALEQPGALPTLFCFLLGEFQLWSPIPGVPDHKWDGHTDNSGAVPVVSTRPAQQTKVSTGVPAPRMSTVGGMPVVSM